MPKKESVSRVSASVVPDQIARLKECFPEVVSEGRIDFDKLRVILGDAVVEGSQERFSFTWTG